MTLQHLRSSTANKRPLPTGMSDGQLAINTNLASPGVFFKDSNGDLVKAGPVHVGATAPNASPAAGGQTGNTKGELWLDTSLTPNELKTWDGSAWVSATGQEIPVSKLIDGSARQLLQTDAAGTGVEWTSNVDVPGTLDVTGIATFDERIRTIVGSASTPAITPATDTNTGIAFTGADVVNIVSNSTAIVAVEKDNATADVQITGKVKSTNTSSASAFIPTSSTVPTNGVYLPAANSVALSTNGTERLRVDGTGITKLYGDGSTQCKIYGHYGGGLNWIIGNEGNQNLSINAFDAYPVVFKTNGTERLRITSAGLVGIGSSNPQTPFVCSNAGANGFEVDPGQSAGTVTGVNSYNRSTSAFTPLRLNASELRFDTASTERMRLTSTGLGIGTSTVNSDLHVYDGTGDAEIRITSNSSNQAILRFGNTVDQTLGSIRFDSPTDSLQFYGLNDSERFRCDSSGRLLVGTSSARVFDAGIGGATPLVQVEGGGDDSILSITRNSPNIGTPRLVLGKSRGSSDGSTTIVQGDDYLGQVSFEGTDGTSFVQAARIDAFVDGTPGANDMPGRLVFSTTSDGASSPTERMKIANNGQTNLFSSTNTSTIELRNGSSSGTVHRLLYGLHSATNNTNGTPIYSIFTNGTVGTPSDIRLKKNVESARSGYLADINDLRVVKYHWKTQDDAEPKELGLIAQEVEEVFPGLIHTEREGDSEVKEIKRSVIPFILLKALQEADAKIEAQQVVINDLLARVTALETP